MLTNAEKARFSELLDQVDDAIDDQTISTFWRQIIEEFGEDKAKEFQELLKQQAQIIIQQADRCDMLVEEFKAVADFLESNMYADIAEAANHLGLTDQEVWDKIMDEAGLPSRPMPDIDLPDEF